MMLNQLRQIAIFAKTVEHGSFRAAAKVLHLSPSVVSHHIAKLEEELGVALLYRSTRKLSLTYDGEALLVSAHAMMESAENFFSVATNQSTQLIGELSVALPAVMQQSKVINEIGNFVNLHPNMLVNLDFSDLVRDLIKDGIDVAIRMGWLEDSGLKARKLYDVKRCVVGSANYVNSKPNKITIEEIETWDWIELSQVGFNNLFSFKNNPKRMFKPKARIRVNSAFAMQQLVANDNGLAALPEFVIEDKLASGEFIQILPDVDIPSIGVYAVWPANAPKGGMTSQFVEYLKDKMTEY